jgi:hypothetical protein
VTPGTPPPVATGTPPSPDVPLVPWLQDRTLKLAAITAVLFGIIGGTAYGVLATSPKRTTASGSPSVATTTDVAPVVPPREAAPLASAAIVEPAVPALPIEPQQTAVGLTAAPPAVTPPRTAVSPPAARTPSAPPRAPAKVESVDSGLGPSTLDEVQRRFVEFDRRPKAKPAATAVKQAPAAAAAPQRPRETVF